MLLVEPNDDVDLKTKKKKRKRRAKRKKLTEEEKIARNQEKKEKSNDEDVRTINRTVAKKTSLYSQKKNEKLFNSFEELRF